MMQPCVYILASGRNGTIYIGVTADLMTRAYQHRENLVPGFTKKYRVHTLVWCEFHATMPEAIAREKAIKEWRREWKLELIQSSNPYWLDLYPALV
jgi:putative endonuclease